MRPFQYQRAGDAKTAISMVASRSSAKFVGGGTNLVDLMREGIEGPTHLVDISRLPLAELHRLPNGGVRIGAAAKNSDMANHPLILQLYPLLAKALLSGASPQLRNMATAAGNLMQRTRCYYFMDTGFQVCNKREPGSGCAALEGQNRMHAIFGASESCIAVHPSDMCVALAALDAVVQVEGSKGKRSIAIHDFHRLPGRTPHIETNLRADELILAIDLPPAKFGNRVQYLKIRDRQSFAFALVSCAAALEMDGDMIRSARLAFGGVAHKPWRSFKAEQSLVGERASKETFARAGLLATEGAQPRNGNAYKVALVRRAAERALLSAAGGLA
jgi:xanthine dehydrogenase YagS FAD-binding subunit